MAPGEGASEQILRRSQRDIKRAERREMRGASIALRLAVSTSLALHMETNNSQLVIYNTSDGTMSIDVTVQNETVWLSQGQMAELFDKNQSVIARHISNVFNEGELERESNMQILHNTLSKFKPT